MTLQNGLADGDLSVAIFGALGQAIDIGGLDDRIAVASQTSIQVVADEVAAAAAASPVSRPITRANERR